MTSGNGRRGCRKKAETRTSCLSFPQAMLKKATSFHPEGRGDGGSSGSSYLPRETYASTCTTTAETSEVSLSSTAYLTLRAVRVGFSLVGVVRRLYESIVRSSPISVSGWLAISGP